MKNEKSLATVVADAYDGLLAGINKMPPFRWAATLAEWLMDKLTAAIERATHKEENMDDVKIAVPGISAEEATENIRRNMELLNRPPLSERVREEFRQIFTEKIHRPGAEKLLDWLDRNEFFTAPASSKHHLAIPGGLALHSLNVYRRLVEIAEKEEDGQTPAYKTQVLPLESIAIMALLHDVCKTDCYHRDPATGAYKFRDPLPMGHGEKSVYMITRYMELYPTEAMAIRWHMGFSDNDFKAGGFTVGNAFEKYPLALLTHIADLQATYLDEAEGTGKG